MVVVAHLLCQSPYILCGIPAVLTPQQTLDSEAICVSKLMPRKLTDVELIVQRTCTYYVCQEAANNTMRSRALERAAEAQG